MRHLYEYGLPADKKDTERIQGIMDKAKGDIAKATKLAQNMAKAIKDNSKMQRRYQAAVDLLGADHPVAKAFNPSGADTTPAPSKPATPKSALEQVLDQNPQILSDIKAAFKFKGLNFDSFNKSKLMVLTPAEAFKYGGAEGDKYFKIWVADGRIGFVTWANTMIDTKFRWNAKGKGADKRDQANIIGTKADIDGFYKSNNYIKKMETVFMMPFEAFGKVAVNMVEDERKRAMLLLQAVKSGNLDGNKLFIQDKLKIADEISAYCKSVWQRYSALIEKIQVQYVTSLKLENESPFSSSIVKLEGRQEYGDYIGLRHTFWFDISIPACDYGTHDWNGHTRSFGYSYDVAKKYLKEKGIKTSFATDCKKVAKEVIRELKKIDWEEFKEARNLYKKELPELKSSLTSSIKTSVFNSLISLGIFRKDKYFLVNGVECYLYSFGNECYLRPIVWKSSGVVPYSKTEIRNRIKQFIKSNSDKVAPQKVDGTTIPDITILPSFINTFE